MFEESFGDIFRRLRRASGFKSQLQLAEASGVSQATISRIEDGTQKPQKETLMMLADALRIPYVVLLEKALIQETPKDEQKVAPNQQAMYADPSRKPTLSRITLTVGEVASLTGLSTAFIYRLVARGEIPHKRVGRLILFHKPTVESWLQGEDHS